MKKALRKIMLFMLIISIAIIPSSVWATGYSNIGSASILRSALTSQDGGTYKLTKDISGLTNYIKVSKGTHTLDLNGHTIKGKNKNYSLIYVTGGKLTIKDSSDDNSGAIINTSNQDAVGCSGGRLIINGGKFSGSEYAVFVTKNAKVTINKGSFTGKKRCVCIHGGTIQINSGEFTSDYDTLSMEVGKLKVSGGSFTSKESDALNINTVNNTNTVTVTGGTFKGGNAAVSMQNQAIVEISGGSFSGNNKDLLVYDTFLGRLKYEKSLFLKVSDQSPAGLGVTETEFKRVNVDYTENMVISDGDSLYSLIMYASENMMGEISFVTDEHLYNVYSVYNTKWLDGRYKNLSENISNDFVDGKPLVKVKVSLTYQLGYQVEALLRDNTLKSKASTNAQKYAKKINTILSKVVTKGMTKKAKVKAVNNYMVKNYSYDYRFKPASFEFYGALNNRKAVCQGYATLFRLFMVGADIPCECIKGSATSGPGKSDYQAHMWNRVKINNQWLYLDVTFNDGMGSNKFLLLTKSKFYGKGYHY